MCGVRFYLLSEVDTMAQLVLRNRKITNILVDSRDRYEAKNNLAMAGLHVEDEQLEELKKIYAKAHSFSSSSKLEANSLSMQELDEVVGGVLRVLTVGDICNKEQLFKRNKKKPLNISKESVGVFDAEEMNETIGLLQEEICLISDLDHMDEKTKTFVSYVDACRKLSPSNATVEEVISVAMCTMKEHGVFRGKGCEYQADNIEVYRRLECIDVGIKDILDHKRSISEECDKRAESDFKAEKDRCRDQQCIEEVDCKIWDRAKEYYDRAINEKLEERRIYLGKGDTVLLFGDDFFIDYKGTHYKFSLNSYSIQDDEFKRVDITSELQTDDMTVLKSNYKEMKSSVAVYELETFSFQIAVADCLSKLPDEKLEQLFEGECDWKDVEIFTLVNMQKMLNANSREEAISYVRKAYAISKEHSLSYARECVLSAGQHLGLDKNEYDEVPKYEVPKYASDRDKEAGDLLLKWGSSIGIINERGSFKESKDFSFKFDDPKMFEDFVKDVNKLIGGYQIPPTTRGGLPVYFIKIEEKESCFLLFIERAKKILQSEELKDLRIQGESDAAFAFRKAKQNILFTSLKAASRDIYSFGTIPYSDVKILEKEYLNLCRAIAEDPGLAPDPVKFLKNILPYHLDIAYEYCTRLKGRLFLSDNACRLKENPDAYKFREEMEKNEVESVKDLFELYNTTKNDEMKLIFLQNGLSHLNKLLCGSYNTKTGDMKGIPPSKAKPFGDLTALLWSVAVNAQETGDWYLCRSIALQGRGGRGESMRIMGCDMLECAAKLNTYCNIISISNSKYVSNDIGEYVDELQKELEEIKKKREIATGASTKDESKDNDVDRSKIDKKPWKKSPVSEKSSTSKSDTSSSSEDDVDKGKTNVRRKEKSSWETSSSSEEDVDKGKTNVRRKEKSFWETSSSSEEDVDKGKTNVRRKEKSSWETSSTSKSDTPSSSEEDELNSVESVPDRIVESAAEHSIKAPVIATVVSIAITITAAVLLGTIGMGIIPALSLMFLNPATFIASASTVSIIFGYALPIAAVACVGCGVWLLVKGIKRHRVKNLTNPKKTT